MPLRSSLDPVLADASRVNRCRYVGIAALLLLGGLMLAALLTPLPPAARSPGVSALLDFGHVVLFATLTTAVWVTTGRPLAAWACGLAGAVLVEPFQLLTGRTADPRDAAWGVLGCLLAGLLLTTARRPVTLGRLVCGLMGACLLVSWPLVVTVPVVWDAWRSYREFPVISHFEHAGSQRRWIAPDIPLRRVAHPGAAGQYLGRLEIDGRQRGELILIPIVTNWTGYANLQCRFSLRHHDAQVFLSIRDGQEILATQQRFELQRAFTPGDHRIEIDLAQVAQGADFSPVDLSRVESFHLIVTAKEGCTFDLEILELTGKRPT